jgi:hypothetical protein
MHVSAESIVNRQSSIANRQSTIPIVNPQSSKSAINNPQSAIQNFLRL